MLQTSTGNVALYFQNFLKTVHALRINETNFILRNIFIDNVFALESENESRNDEGSLFLDYLRIPYLAVNS